MKLLVPAAVVALIGAVGLNVTVADIPAARSTVATPAPVTRTQALVTRNAAIGAGSAQPAGGRLTLPVALTWPLSPRPTVRRRFEQPRSQWSRGHRGVDLLASVGQSVLSAGDGAVAFSGMVAGRGVITVAHAGGLRTSYEPVEARLPAGTLVHRGTRIAVVSATAGHCVPLTCLHWGALSGNVYLDPLSLLGFGRPVLLPLG